MDFKIEYLRRYLKFCIETREFESEIENYKGEDPLDPWTRYVSFLEQANLSFSKKKSEVITRCVQAFFCDARYKSDKRFVELFIQSVSNVPSPATRVTFLMRALNNNEIGDKLSRMYLAIAENYELNQQYPKAVEIINAGIEKKAHPIEYLQDGLTQLQYRVSQKLMQDMNENGQVADLRSFGDCVPVYGPENDAPSIRTHLPPAVPTQSKPVVKKDVRPRVSLFEDINSAIDDAKLPNETLTSEAVSLAKTKSDKENQLEPSKWNKAENTIAVRGEFCPPSRSQIPLQLYVDDTELTEVHHNVEAKKKPLQGVLSDRKEKTEFTKPNDVIPPANVKICYRKNQIFQDGKELTFEHLRAMEYRKTLASKAVTALKSDSVIIHQIQCERDQLLEKKDKEIESLKQEIIELKQYRDKADFDRIKLLQKLADLEPLENHSKELETDNKKLKMHLNSLEESYHNLNNERDSLLKELCNATNGYENLRLVHEKEVAFRMSQEKQMNVNIANWKTDMYEQIRTEEETRLKKEFMEAHTLLKANFDENVKQQTQDLTNLLESEKQRYRELEKKYSDLFELKNMSRVNADESIKQKSDISIIQSDILSSASHVNISTSMCSDSIPCHSLASQVDMSISHSNTLNTNSATLGNTKPMLTVGTASVTNDENISFPTTAPVFKISATASNSGPASKVEGFLEPKFSRPFRLPKKVDPVSKMAPFSLYESHSETLGQGNSILQDGLLQKPKLPPVTDYRNLPENRPLFTDFNDENKVPDVTEVRKPLKTVLSTHTSASPEEQRDDERMIYGAMCDEKTMDFNITNNLTRALAIAKPLLNSTPDEKERRHFSRRKSIGRIPMRETPSLENETSVYAVFSDDDDCETGAPEYTSAPQNHLNFTEAPIIQNLSTIQETSKENRSTYTTSSSSGSNMTNTNITRGFGSLSNFTRSGSSVSRHYVSQSYAYNNNN